MRCRHCNSTIYKKIEELLDPKKELCDKCYVKLGELDEITLILELDIKIKHSSLSEMVDYFESIANYTVDVKTYGITFKKRDSTLNKIKKYMIRNKWTFEGFSDYLEKAIYSPNKKIFIMIPTKEEFSDYNHRVEQIIEKLSIIHNLSKKEVLRQINKINLKELEQK